MQGTNRETSYEYDDAGRLSKVTRPTVSVHGVGSDEPEVLYAYDGFGRLMKTTDSNGNDTAYQYDPLRRLTKVTGAAVATLRAEG